MAALWGKKRGKSNAHRGNVRTLVWKTLIQEAHRKKKERYPQSWDRSGTLKKIKGRLNLRGGLRVEWGLVEIPTGN